MAFHFTNVACSQVPTNCFEIESILADDCGSPEGENEMVHFHYLDKHYVKRI